MRTNSWLSGSSSFTGRSTPISANGRLTWETCIPILTNPFLLWDFFKVVLPAVAVFSGVVILVTRGSDIPRALGIGGAIVFLLAGAYLAAGLILGNKLDVRYDLTPAGVRFRLMPAPHVNRLLLILSRLAASSRGARIAVGDTGAEELFIPWAQVRKAVIYPARRVIALRNARRVRLRLYCTASNFTAVRGYVGQRVQDIVV